MAKDSAIELIRARTDQRDLEGLEISLPKTNDNNGINFGDEQAEVSSSDDSVISEVRTDNGLKERTRATNEDNHDDQDEGNAEGLAGLINDASLTGTGHSSTNDVGKEPGGVWGLVNGIISGFRAGSPHKPPKTADDNNDMVDRPLSSENHGKPHPLTAQNISATTSEIATSNENPSAAFRRLPRRSVTSNTQTPRSSGRPDPYEVPPSPTRSSGADLKQNGLKPKRTVIRETPKKLVADVGDATNAGEDGVDKPEEHIELAQHSPTRVTRAKSKQAMVDEAVIPKHATRSIHAGTVEPHNSSQLPGERSKLPRKVSPELRRPSGPAPLVTKQERGRPRKDKGAFTSTEGRVAEPQGSSDDPVGTAERRTHVRQKPKEVWKGEDIEMTPAKEPEQEVVEESAQSGEEGVTGILLDSSPAKAKQQASRRPLTRPSASVQSTAGHLQRVLTQPVTVEPRGQASVNAGILENVQSGASSDEKNIDHEPVRQPEEKPETSFITKETLKKMVSIINQVGRNAKGKYVASNEGYRTALGRILTKATNKLISKYEDLKEIRSAQVVNLEKVEEEQQKALGLLEIIENKARTVLSDRLGDTANGGKNGELNARTNVLTDLYMKVIPGLVDALDAAVKQHDVQSTLTTPHLEEITKLVKVLCDLATAAQAEDRSTQPKAPRTNPYQISGPARKLLSIVKKLSKQCEGELNARDIARRFEEEARKDEEARRRVEEARRMAPERARKKREWRAEKEREEEEAYQERLKDRSRLILKSLNERRAQLGLDPCSQQTRVPSSSQQKLAPLRSQQLHTLTDDEDPYDEDSEDGNMRLKGVFGRNNSHPGTTPKEWTRAEMETLVDGLRRERGPTRYEKIASRLERTLDEIFDRAKYLKVQVEYTLKRLQEENPDMQYPPMKPWIENIGSEGFLSH